MNDNELSGYCLLYIKEVKFSFYFTQDKEKQISTNGTDVLLQKAFFISF